MRALSLAIAGLLTVGAAVATGGCQPAPRRAGTQASAPAGTIPASKPGAAPKGTQQAAGDRKLGPLPGMPSLRDPTNVYAATGPGMLSPEVEGHRELVYVPNTISDDVSVIDPKTFQVIDTFPGGPEPQHVVPSYDLRTLFVAADRVPRGAITPIDPATGKPGKLVDVQDVYNLYFTPDGRFAVVVAEYYQRLDFYDPATGERRESVSLPDCEGANHLDYTADGRTALIACEFNNSMVVLDVEQRKQIRTFKLTQVKDGMPQDTRLAPDGKRFYTADMMAGGVYVFNGDATKQIGFIPTGDGAHGIYFSRDAKRMFVTNRGEGSVSVLDPVDGKVLEKWRIEGGGSPDMGALSPDGSQLWLSGRYDDVVYVLDTNNGHLIKKIKVGRGPHGLLYWPQPGRFSLGHTANLR
jgi:YVTN family beta-propeller protein